MKGSESKENSDTRNLNVTDQELEALNVIKDSMSSQGRQMYKHTHTNQRRAHSHAWAHPTQDSPQMHARARKHAHAHTRCRHLADSQRESP